MLRVVASNVVMRLRHGHIIDLLRSCKHSTLKAETPETAVETEETEDQVPKESERMAEFRKKLQGTPEKTEGFTADDSIRHTNEDDPLPPWPDETNPHTGEIGGPRGPEPTRYGDWERKGRVSDF